MPNQLASAGYDSPPWQDLADPVLIQIFCHLPPASLLNSSQTCKHWHQVALDEYLWAALFRSRWPSAAALPGEGACWRGEYRRLHYRTVSVESEVLKDHRDQVLHVAFSHDGRLFSTCSKDGYVKVWTASYPASVKYYADMREFTWKYTQFAQFNYSDTLLLVSGVHFGSHSTSGEIAIFNIIEGFELQCRVLNKPYDVFGSWYNDSYLLSGNVHWLGNLTSCSVLWLNKAYQALEFEHESVVMRLYKFYNVNANSVRTILIADCETDSSVGSGADRTDKSTTGSVTGETQEQGVLTADKDNLGVTAADTDSDMSLSGSATSVGSAASSSAADSIPRGSGGDKLLIYTTGVSTYTPHCIGVKRIEALEPRYRLRTTHGGRAGLMPGVAQPPAPGAVPPHEADRDSFDTPDHLIEMHGHIIGMALSPDHRYLYVNCRAWPQNYRISNALNPPPIAQEIDIHRIDLTNMQKSDTVLRAHKAYTPNEDCFFIFLDVCEQYVASGAEDKHGYLWDRHYGVFLTKLQHLDIVNSVAFNPQDSEMLITASDDHTVKIWRSKNREKQLRQKYPLKDVRTAE